MASTLTSASSNAEIEAAYVDNASYQEDADPVKARAFVTACRIILLIRPQRTARGNAVSLEYNLELIKEQLQEAQRWLAANPAALGAGNPAIRHPDFTCFRD
jgi:hypothetical protein